MSVPCVFCNPDERYVLAKTDLCLAACFPDSVIKPGHYVVAPRQHVESFSGLSPDQAADILRFAAYLAGTVEKIVGAEKMYLVAIADQVRHFHLHMMPKMPGDPPLGPHIMSDTGWRGKAVKQLSASAVYDFIQKVQATLST